MILSGGRSLPNARMAKRAQMLDEEKMVSPIVALRQKWNLPVLG